MCTGTTPTVRGVILAAASAASIPYHASTSTNTGVASAKQIASTVGNAVCEGTRISSPAFTPSARKAIQSAAVPELVSTACFTSSSTGGRESGTGGGVTGSGSSETVVLAAEVDQRHAIGGFTVLDATDEDGVVPLDVLVDGDALHVRQRLREDREAELAHPVRDAVELVEARGREPLRDVLLRGAQEVHRE